MKILVALDNSSIKEELDKIYKNRVYMYDITTMESVIEFLSKRNEDFIVITKDNLTGKMDKYSYIKKIKGINKNNRVIFIIENLTKEDKENLFANEVFSIIEGESINIKKICNLIDNDDKVVYLKENNTKINEQNKNVYTNFERPQFIAVYGTNGSGKSIIASTIAKHIAEITTKKVSLLDMNFCNPSIDIINNVYCSNDLILQIINEYKNKNFNFNILEKMVKDNKYSNLYYLTNISNVNKNIKCISRDYYKRIYKNIKKNSFYSIVDLSSDLFLDIVPYTLNIASVIIFVVNPNYISIRQAYKYLHIIKNIWNINSSKVYILINKSTDNSLDKRQINSILNNYNIIGNIKNLSSLEGCINGTNEYIGINEKLDKLYKILDININTNSNFSYNMITNKLINKIKTYSKIKSK